MLLARAMDGCSTEGFDDDRPKRFTSAQERSREASSNSKREEKEAVSGLQTVSKNDIGFRQAGDCVIAGNTLAEWPGARQV